MHLKAQLKECKTDQISQPPLKVTQDVIVPNVEGKHRLAALFAEIVSTQNDILLMTRQVRELEIKIHQRQRRLDDLCLVSINSAHLERSSFKTDSAILRMQKKHESVVARIREAEKKLIIIRQQLSNLENSDINLKNVIVKFCYTKEQ